MDEFEKMGTKDDFNSAIDNMMRQLLARDVMYLPMKQIQDKARDCLSSCPFNYASWSCVCCVCVCVGGGVQGVPYRRILSSWLCATPFSAPALAPYFTWSTLVAHLTTVSRVARQEREQIDARGVPNVRQAVPGVPETCKHV